MGELNADESGRRIVMLNAASEGEHLMLSKRGEHVSGTMKEMIICKEFQEGSCGRRRAQR